MLLVFLSDILLLVLYTAENMYLKPTEPVGNCFCSLLIGGPGSPSPNFMLSLLDYLQSALELPFMGMSAVHAHHKPMLILGFCNVQAAVS